MNGERHEAAVRWGRRRDSVDEEDLREGEVEEERHDAAEDMVLRRVEETVDDERHEDAEEK